MTLGSHPVFHDRLDTGRKLAEDVVAVIQDPDALVLALPRGGVPVAFEVARRLRAQLDVFPVRKLGLPGEEELAIGALASGGVRVINEDLVQELHLHEGLINSLTALEKPELMRRGAQYRQGRPAVPVRGRTLVLVDDGLATGASMTAASQALRLAQPERIVVAVPVAAEETCDQVSRYSDKIVCAHTPQAFLAVGIWYEDFSQTSDEEVQRLLQQAEREWGHTQMARLLERKRE